MEQISNAVELKNEIRQLEIKRMAQEELLKDEAKALAESMKPINILKRTVVNSNIVKSTFQKGGITGNLIQIGAAYLLNRIFKKKH